MSGRPFFYFIVGNKDYYKFKKLNMSKSEAHINKLEQYIYKCIQKNELSNKNLVQIIKRINCYLNLKTIQKYATDNKISYNGAKNNRTITMLFGVKFIADNE